MNKVWLGASVLFILSLFVFTQFPQFGHHATNYMKLRVQGDASDHPRSCNCAACMNGVDPNASILNASIPNASNTSLPNASLPTSPGYHPPLQLFERWDDPKCGNWQRDYADLHKNITARKREDQRLLVYQRAHLGLGDQLSVAASWFVFALLSGRAFRIVSNDNVFNYSYDSPSGIDWTSVPSDLEGEGVHNWAGRENDFDYRFRSTNLLTQVPENVRTIYYSEGYAHAQLRNIFDNPNHKDQLSKMGFRKETSFGCILNFLFRPSPPVLKIINPIFEELNRRHVEHPGRLVKIAVHMRFGDNAIQGIDHDCSLGKQSSKWTTYSRCVSEIESRFDNTTKFVWLIFTDCSKAKDDIQQAYPDKVIKTQIAGKDIHYAQNSGLSGKDLVTAEHYLLGLMDMFVMPKDSTFSHSGGLRVWNESLEFYTFPLSSGNCQSRDSATGWDAFASEGWVHMRR